MRLAVLKERRPAETRVAATPDTVKKLIGLGLTVAVEAGAGAASAVSDAEFAAAGAEIAPDAAATLAGAGIVFTVQMPEPAERALIPRGALLVTIAGAHGDPALLPALAEAGIDVAAMELLPRISRAQAMDVLSSQANLAGYRAVIEAAGAFPRGFPMMMTAAGTVPPARVFVIGAGVAGLQAIATARRLGAIVSATDVRAAAKEQVESLGASFITVDEEAAKSAETSGGYAREMGEDYQRRQREKVTEALRRTDIVICTALIPGRKAPTLLTAGMVGAMASGSVIVDLAVEAGGNVEGSEAGAVVTTENGVRIVGHLNFPSRIAVDASMLYARNLMAFLALLFDAEKHFRVDTADEIVKATLLTMDGVVVNPALAPAEPAPAAS